MKISIFFLLVNFLLSTHSFASIIGIGSSTAYRTLNLTKQGNVALSTCKLTSAPVINCDPEGLSTMVIDRALFDSKLSEIANYDDTILSDAKTLRDQEAQRKTFEDNVHSFEVYIKDSERDILAAEAKKTLLSNQILDVRKKLQDPKIDPQDRMALEAFIKNNEKQISSSEQVIADAKDRMGKWQKELLRTKELITSIDKLILEKQQKIESRKKLLEDKVLELQNNLDQNQIATAYSNESLYFVAFFVFDKKSGIPDTQNCSAEARFTNGLASVHAQIKLSPGIYPKMVRLGKRVIELFNGGTYDLSILETGKGNWIRSGEIFDFTGPRQELKVKCIDNSGIAGREEFMLEKINDGNLIPENHSCNGGPARAYSFLNLSYVGRHNQKEAKIICESIEAYRDYEVKSEVFNNSYYDFVSQEILFNETVFNSPFAQFLKVTNNENLPEGFFAWGSSTKPYLFQYFPNKAQLINFQGSANQSSLPNWELPTICSARIESASCDE